MQDFAYQLKETVKAIDDKALAQKISRDADLRLSLARSASSPTSSNPPSSPTTPAPTRKIPPPSPIFPKESRSATSSNSRASAVRPASTASWIDGAPKTTKSPSAP